MALNEINKTGGLKGKKIELLFEDDTGKPDIARAAAEKLISKDKVVMLGRRLRKLRNLCHCRGGPAKQDPLSDQYRRQPIISPNRVGILSFG